MNKVTKRILIGTGVVAGGLAAVSALSYALTSYMVNIALDRGEQREVSPKALEVLTGSSDLDEFLKYIDEQSHNLLSADCRTVRLTAKDGTELIAHLRLAPNPKRTILAMHGWRSGWARDFGMIAEFWHQNNCNVLYVEQRAQGESGGEYMGFGMLERYDCLDWINWLNQNGFAELPLYLGGVSMGAATVLMSAAFDLPQNVRGIIADCAFTSAQAIWRHVAKNNIRMAYTGLHALIASDMCKRKIQLGSADFTTLDAMQQSHVPILFIHGTDDHFVPVEMTYENYKACTSEKRLLVVPGADHGMSYFVDKEGYEAAMLNFFKDFDNI